MIFQGEFNMKTSVSSYSFGGYFGSLGYLGIIDKAKEIGFDGIEYTDGAYMNEADSAKKIKERCAELGLETVALAVGANFLASDLDGEIARLKKMVDYAAEVGFKMMRHDVAGGYGPDKKHSRGYDNALPIIAKGVREVTAYAEQKGVRTMTENHGYFSQDAARVEKLINTVAHDNFGALVDMGNFMCADEDPSLSVSIMAPYAFHVHAKDFHFKSGMDVNPGAGWFQTRAGNYIRGAIIGHGEAKIYQSIQTMKRAGYDGFITIEFEGMEDNLKGISLGLQNLKRFIG
ncbi:MAG: sugar phosphate isomerase/epimerase [Ruminococcaceae bacterium]|nr:sugar phosphate isomerase/epimerase [Oscillospiraceae bacterium]